MERFGTDGRLRSAFENAGGLAGAKAPAVTLAGGWISSPAWDFFWMFSALWGAALLLAGSAFAPVGAVAGLLFLANRLLATGHAWSTSFMVLFSSLLAEERRRRPALFVAAPIAIAALAFGLGFAVAAWPRFPSDGQGHPGQWAWLLYILLFWVGHFWHFGNQDFGVLTIYRSRAGQRSAFDRKVDKAYTVAMMFAIQPIVYLSVVRTTGFAEIAWAWLPITPAGMEWAARICLVAATILSVAVVALELSRRNRSLPKLLYYGVIFSHPLLFFAAAVEKNETLAFLYVLAYLWSHWFIALGLVSRINSRHYEGRGDTRGRALLRHGLLMVVITAGVLFATGPYVDYNLFNTDGFQYKRLLAAIAPAQRPLVGLLLGFFLAEQLVHYYCDRRLFRFRDPGVRRQVAPLLFGAGRTNELRQA